MKRITTHSLFLLTVRGVTTEIIAEDARDLAEQVTAGVGSRQAGLLARAVWGDEQADIRLFGVVLVSSGRVVRETWRRPPAQKTDSPVPLTGEPRSAGLKKVEDTEPDDENLEPSWRNH
ncbi:hypothetical protein [Deinococcus koreensis]|uniref:Uncharacterized protein n=1 Tax=Deinococcus koreensis TaxID=2054903 RepID=A0A2K3V1T0_9DEIO|nr:hypothetical protein [Deinococcus koreensis]PNY82747.1 hypothetical protein CVO96_16545 [Deinococcus koreensis]